VKVAVQRSRRSQFIVTVSSVALVLEQRSNSLTGFDDDPLQGTFFQTLNSYDKDR